MSAPPGVAQESQVRPRENLDWQDRGACRQLPPAVWFPGRGTGQGRLAKDVCKGCVVKQQCLDYALRHHERYGVWGGMGEKERRALLKAGVS